MDPRKLKRLLDTYREAGVAEVSFNDKLEPTALRFGPAPIQLQADVDGDISTLDLPPGVIDAQAALDRIRKAYQPKGKAS